jgi:hypothetical protein
MPEKRKDDREAASKKKRKKEENPGILKPKNRQRNMV